jgi:hypothetical protein
MSLPMGQQRADRQLNFSLVAAPGPPIFAWRRDRLDSPSTGRNGAVYDGVDAPRRHRCAKVEVLSTT